MLQPTFTNTQGAQPGGAAPGFGVNNNFVMQQMSLFTGGAFTENSGAFIQGTLDGVAHHFTWDNTDMRRQRVLLPVPRVLEMLVHQARTRAEQVSYHALAEGLTETQLDALDTLLAPKPGTALSGMAWVRQAPQSPSARNILALVERVRFIRALGIERDRQRNIPKVAFDRLAAESVRMTVQHVRDLAGIRRHATLVAAATSIETNLTDTTLLMFDKLMGSLARKAERRTANNSLTTLRQAHGNLRTLASACRAMIDAREGKTDPFAAVESRVGWEKFLRSVAEAETWRGPRRPTIGPS